MKKSLFLGIILLLLLSGCTIEYNLDLKEKNYLENTTLLTDITQNEIYENEALTDIFDTKNEYYEPIYSNPEFYDEFEGGYQPGVKYYEIEDYRQNNLKGLKITNDFDIKNYERTRIGKYCYDEINVQENDNIVMLRTSNKCRLFDSYDQLENINVNIKTDFEVVVSNADYVNGNTYTWNINRNNYLNKPLRITYKINKENNDNDIIEEPIDKYQDQSATKPKNNNYNFLIIGVCFTVLIGVMVVVLKFKKRSF